jgi:hypothetical protein
LFLVALAVTALAAWRIELCPLLAQRLYAASLVDAASQPQGSDDCLGFTALRRYFIPHAGWLHHSVRGGCGYRSPIRTEESSVIYENALAWKQLRNAKASDFQSKKDGDWYARLLASNPKIAQTFADHEDVADKLEESKKTDALALICGSGVLDAVSLRPYRQAFNRLVAR